MSDTLAAVSASAVALARLRALGARLGLRVLEFEDVSQVETYAEPAAIVVDLDLERSINAFGSLRERYPTALIAGFLSAPDRNRWEAAQAAGYDLVANRGAIALQVEKRLATWTGPAQGKRFRLFEEADVVGRLGLVHRAGDTPVGPIAVYRLSNRLCAVSDICPHAGAPLSEGTLSEGIITCPKHGSQFDVCDGSRVRGPADDPIRSHPILIEGGIVYLQYD